MTTAASNQGSLRVTGLTAIVDYAVSSHARAVAVLVLAALLGAVLNNDAAERNKDSELLDLNT